MNKKVCIKLAMFVFAIMSLIPQESKASPYDNSPVLPFYGPEPKPVGYRSNIVPPPPPGVKKQKVYQDVPEVNMAVEALVNKGDELIGSYVGNATSKIKSVLSKKSTKQELQADRTMLNNAAQVGDDTVALLEARDKEEWKHFINAEFQKDPTAMVEALVPLYQFNPQDVQELSDYIANKRDALGVRQIINQTAQTPYWESAQQGIEQVSGTTSFVNSPEARKIKNEFKGHFTKNTQKVGQKLLKAGQEAAEKNAENYWNNVKNKAFGPEEQ